MNLGISSPPALGFGYPFSSTASSNPLADLLSFTNTPFCNDSFCSSSTLGFSPFFSFLNTFLGFSPYGGSLASSTPSTYTSDPWSELATKPYQSQVYPLAYPPYPSPQAPQSAPITSPQVPTQAVSGLYAEAKRHYQEVIGDANLGQIVLEGMPIEALLISPKNLDPNKAQSPLIIDAGHGGKASGGSLEATRIRTEEERKAVLERKREKQKEGSYLASSDIDTKGLRDPNDNGASASGTSEVEIIDEVVKKLIQQALADGRPVILTNPLHSVAEGKKINEQRAADTAKLHKYFPNAMGVSLHANSGASSGHWIVWNDKGPKNGSDKLAAALSDSFNSSSGIPKSGNSKILAVSENKDQDGDLRGLNLTDTGNIPLVLVEMGFLNNKEEREAMLKKPEAYAQAIYKGLDAQFIDRSTGTGLASAPQQPSWGTYPPPMFTSPYYGYPQPYPWGYPPPQMPLVGSGDIL